MNGFSTTRGTFNIDADAIAEKIAALVAQSQKRSVGFDIITKPTNLPNLPIYLTYQPTNLPTYQPTNLPTYQPTNLPTYQTYQPTNVTVSTI